ncbi:polymorphic outer membrane protein middle domain-containing protein [Chlamydia vaughanii]|uniref:polymorphic outer membrane protein middle domain-containing protein n=1 Tax=Chlamydia vaughanii TaxID=3112552 RepID=UPI0032B10C87
MSSYFRPLSRLILLSLCYPSLCFSGTLFLKNNNVDLRDLLQRIDQIASQPNLWGGQIHNDSADIALTNISNCCIQNQGFGHGGAITARNLNISDNKGLIIFQKNMASGQGGAIRCSDTCNITNNLQGVVFQNNYSRANAGAIFARVINIRDNGPVLFLNNSAQWGGALQNADGQKNGQIYLSADYGNIIFNGNVRTKYAHIFGRNAFHSAMGIAKVDIGARKGHKVIFYDPIENEHTTAQGLTFNPESYHLGTVLFSGASTDENSFDDDYLSILRNTTKIANGVVAIDDKAIVSTYNLTQDQGTLRLGNDIILTTATKKENTSDTTGCALTITNLALNIPALIKPKAQAPKIWIYPSRSGSTYTEDDKPAITISGPLLLFDSENNDPHDSLDLSGAITKVPFLYLCENANKKINVDNLNIEAINDSVHYGYQGIWSPYWEAYTTTADSSSALTANTAHRILYADWTPTHRYIPNPKFNTPLVANALWQTFYSTMSGLHSFPKININENPSNFEYSGQGLGIALRQKSKNKAHGFHMKSIGCSFGGSSTTETNHRLAFAFAQQFSRLKEKVSKNKLSSKNTFGGVQILFPWDQKHLITTGSLAYSYGDHKIKNSYEEDNKTSEGSFYTHSFAATINCSWLLPSSNNHFTVVPFIEAKAFRAALSRFEENGDYIRKFFLKRPLRTITTPAGMIVQWSSGVYFPSTWELQLAYQPIVYKQYPKVVTTLVASNGMWASLGTPVSRHAFTATLNNETDIFYKLKVFLNYHGEISSSTFSNYLKVGSALHF